MNENEYEYIHNGHRKVYSWSGKAYCYDCQKLRPVYVYKWADGSGEVHLCDRCAHEASQGISGLPKVDFN